MPSSPRGPRHSRLVLGATVRTLRPAGTVDSLPLVLVLALVLVLVLGLVPVGS